MLFQFKKEEIFYHTYIIHLCCAHKDNMTYPQPSFDKVELLLHKKIIVKNGLLGYQEIAIIILNMLLQFCDQNCGVQCLYRHTDTQTE